MAGFLLALSVLLAACGSGTPTPTLTPRPTPTPTPVVTPTPEVTPSPTPVPTPSPTDTPSPTAGPIDQATSARLQAALNTFAIRAHIPAVSAAVVLGNGSSWSGQHGVLAIGSKTAATANTLFSVGSITKTFTGALILKLVEDGSLALDDPLAKYLPTYPNASKITIRMLMDHTSGIRDIFEAAIFKYFDANHSKLWTPQQVLALIGKPYFAPGAGYHYSNTNYIILGLVLEKVTGETELQLAQTEILQPFGLDHTFLQWEQTPSGPLAHGYAGTSAAPVDISKGQALLPYASEATAVGAAAGIVSTATDIARWASALYGGQFLDQASIAAMTDFSLTARFKPRILYGLACEQLPISGHVAWGHRGHLDGFQSAVAYFPETGITVALLTDADWPGLLPVIGSLYTALGQ